VTLGQMRQRIDRMDRQLLRLLNRRAAAVVRIGQFKKRRGLPVYDGRREEEVVRRMTRSNRGPLSEESIRGIFRPILRHSRHLQSSAVSTPKGRVR